MEIRWIWFTFVRLGEVCKFKLPMSEAMLGRESRKIQIDVHGLDHVCRSRVEGSNQWGRIGRNVREDWKIGPTGRRSKAIKGAVGD